VSNILLPLGALLIAVFVPLKIKREVLQSELQVSSTWGRRLFLLWLFLLRFAAPIAIVVVFLHMLGVF
ncbi:MAG TPA: hypothetical protein VEZ13_12690, partial [Brevibacillus sp.]|nr:hypothetical protein [Brevibacillus sp.]